MSATAAVQRSKVNDAVRRAEEGRRRLWDRYRIVGEARRMAVPNEDSRALNDELYDDLDFQQVAIETLLEGARRATKLMRLAAEQLAALDRAHDPAVANLIKALGEAVGELS